MVEARRSKGCGVGGRDPPGCVHLLTPGAASLYSETTGCTRARCSSQWRGLSFRRDSTMFRRSSLMCAFALIVVSQVFAKQPEAGAKPDLSALWQDLGDADGEKAFRAMRYMA